MNSYLRLVTNNRCQLVNLDQITQATWEPTPPSEDRRPKLSIQLADATGALTLVGPEAIAAAATLGLYTAPKSRHAHTDLHHMRPRDGQAFNYLDRHPDDETEPPAVVASGHTVCWRDQPEP